MKLNISQKKEFKKKGKVEDKQEISESGVDQEVVKDILKQRKVMNQLKEKNNNARKGKIKFACREQVHLDQAQPILEEEKETEEELLETVPEPETTDKGVVLANQVSQNDNLFRCDVCNKGFKKKRGLVIHLKTHESKSRTLKCPCIGKDNKPCEKAFYVKHALNSHMNTHTS